MNEEAPPLLPIEPLPYHREVVRHLKAREPALWRWFSTDRLRAERSGSTRLDLLKTTYRVEPDAHPGLYSAASQAAVAVGLAAPLTLYQSQSAVGLNAALAYIPGEAHVVLSGPLERALSPVELRSVLGHELLHFLLLDRWSGYLTAYQLLAALANDPAAEEVHRNTARLFHLYTEVYCDRGGFLATGDLSATVSSLVKIETGVAEVSAASYLRQAEEIFSKAVPRAEGVTHPETFIRARAARLWVEEPETAYRKVATAIEGAPSFAALDLLAQERLASLTRRLICGFLRERWLQTETLLAHARLFFNDFAPGAAEDPELGDDLAGDGEVRDYFAYVLLDFAAADRELEEAPLAAALLLSEELGLADSFKRIAIKELGLKKKGLEALLARAPELVTRAREAVEEP